MRELIRAFGTAVQWFCWALAAFVLFRLWLLIPDGYPIWLYVGTLLLLFALVKAGNGTRRLCNLAAIKDRANSQLTPRKSREQRLLLGRLDTGQPEKRIRGHL
ncbi:MAG: hypothetical protein WAK55_23215 [Xanthobacteraceae bacterium]